MYERDKHFIAHLCKNRFLTEFLTSPSHKGMLVKYSFGLMLNLALHTYDKLGSSSMAAPRILCVRRL